MQLPGRLLPLVCAFACAGCFQMTTVLKVKGDGSGTIDHRMVYSPRALSQMRSLRAGGGPPVDPASEDQARTLAAAIGPDVSYVTSTPINTPAGQGRDATYAFSDVAQLRVSTQPAAPPGLSDQHTGAERRRRDGHVLDHAESERQRRVCTSTSRNPTFSTRWGRRARRRRFR